MSALAAALRALSRRLRSHPDEAAAVADELAALADDVEGVETTPPGRTYAAPGADPAPEGATPPPACEGCGGPLTPDQARKGARACQPACRVRAHRERARARRLDAIDTAARALAEAREAIERG